MELEQLAADPVAFVAELTVQTSAGPRTFGDVMADFQQTSFQTIATSSLGGWSRQFSRLQPPGHLGFRGFGIRTPRPVEGFLGACHIYHVPAAGRL